MRNVLWKFCPRLHSQMESGGVIPRDTEARERKLLSSCLLSDSTQVEKNKVSVNWALLRLQH